MRVGQALRQLVCVLFGAAFAYSAVLTAQAQGIEVMPADEVRLQRPAIYAEYLGDHDLSGSFQGVDGEGPLDGYFTWDRPDLLLEAGECVQQYTFQPHRPGYLPYRGSIRFWVEPRALTVTVVEVAAKEYDGSTYAEITRISLRGKLSASDVQVEATAAFDSPTAGEGKPVSVTLLGLSGADAHNYELEPALPAVTGSIARYPAATAEPLTIELDTASESGSLNLRSHLRLLGPGDPGSLWPHSVVAVAGDAVFEDAPTVNGDFLVYRTHDRLQAGQAAFVQVDVSSDNYDTVTAEVRFQVGGAPQKEEVEIIGVTVEDKVYDGFAPVANGEPLIWKDGQAEEPASVDWHYLGADNDYSSGLPPVNAGSYELLLSLPDGHALYTGSARVPFTIHRAALAITPEDRSILPGAPVPEDFDFHYQGLVAGENASVVSPAPQAAASLAQSIAGSTAPIVITNEPAADNYLVYKGTGTLTVSPGAVDGSYYHVPEPSASGWYRGPIRVIPAQPAVYDEVSTSAAGPFSPSLTLTEEAGDGAVLLYFRKGEEVSDGLVFRYQMDETAPQVLGVTYSPELERLSVNAVDEMSGVHSFTLTAPDGAQATSETGTFSLGESGSYTVSVSDNAGNTTQVVAQLTVGPKPAADAPSSSRTGGDADSSFWKTVAERIRQAPSGSTVRVTSAYAEEIPTSVLLALQGRDLTLRLVDADRDISINGLSIPPLDTTSDFYSIDELLAIASITRTGGAHTLLPESDPAPVDSGPPQDTGDSPLPSPAGNPQSIPYEAASPPTTAHDLPGGVRVDVLPPAAASHSAPLVAAGVQPFRTLSGPTREKSTSPMATAGAALLITAALGAIAAAIRIHAAEGIQNEDSDPYNKLD